MAFDLHLGNDKSYIGHHEEGVFEKFDGNPDFPMVNWLWENYYSDPVITPEIANKLVHEFIAIRASLEGTSKFKYLLIAIDRILPLLSKGYSTEEIIRCRSD